MDSSKFNKYQQAGEILNKTLQKAIELCNELNNASHVCIYCDTMINQLLGEIFKKSDKGITLPTCLSINEIVAHDSFTERNDYKIKENDIIRIEMACHIDDNVVSIGDTIKVNNIEWNNSYVMNAARKALEVGLIGINPEQPISVFVKNIEKVAKCYNLNLVSRPKIFHEYDTDILFDWVFRDSENFNEPSWAVVKDHELELEGNDFSDEEVDKNLNFTKGEVYHIIIAFTTSSKKPTVSSKVPVIYQNTINKYILKSKSARDLINCVNKNFSMNCFKVTNLDMNENVARLGMKECLNHGVLRSLGLIELKNCETVLLKCSIVIQNNSVYKLTGKKLVNTDPCMILTDELNNILKQPLKFDKRDDFWLSD